MYFCISLNILTVAAKGPLGNTVCVKFSLPKFKLRLITFEVAEENTIPCVRPYYLAIKGAICQQFVNSSGSNALMAVKGDGRWHSHWFIASYAYSG